MRISATWLAGVLAVSTLACGGGETKATATPDATSADAAGDAASLAGDATSPAGDTTGTAAADCDPLQPHCGYPWPSSFYLQADPSTATGYRLRFGGKTLPVNSNGVAVDPKAYEILDGFGVSSSVLVQFPQLDPAGLPTQAQIDLSVQPTSSSVWLELDAAGKVTRWIPHWAELDARPNNANLDGVDPATRVLFLRPGVVLDYGRRYVVAFRKLKAKDGQPIARSPVFQQFVDGSSPDKARQARFGEIFAALKSQGIDTAELTLAWDFVTYSSQAVHARPLELRAKMLAAAGPDGPELTIDPAPKSNCGKDDRVVSLRGTIAAPQFLEQRSDIGGVAMWRYRLDAQGQLAQGGTRSSEFWLRVPKSCMNGQHACDLIQYGHGLLGSGSEACAGWAAENAHTRHAIYFSSNMIGMAGEDSPGVIQILQNINLFPSLPERVSAGVAEHVLFQRAMRKRLGQLDWLKQNGVQLTGNVYWSGNSQGGIYGQTVLALSEDVTRAHLGQSGVNYSMLVERSKDFDNFGLILQTMYPDRADYVLVLSMIQLLWDQVDPVTYARHIGEPFAGLPKHAALVLNHPGDFQVDPVTTETCMRSGFYKKLPFYGRPVPLVAEQPYPLVGSGVVMMDFGNLWGDKANLPTLPESGLDCAGAGLVADGIDDGTCLGAQLCPAGGNFEPCVLGDPHDRAHGLKAHNDQMMHFFRTGEIIDTCGGDGCRPQ
jgi:hypothetical protein